MSISTFGKEDLSGWQVECYSGNLIDLFMESVMFAWTVVQSTNLMKLLNTLELSVTSMGQTPGRLVKR